MRTQREFKEVLDRIAVPGGMGFELLHRGGEYFLRVACDGVCNVTGSPMNWNGRKWLLSPHMTDGEIVQTAFKALMTSLEHEARETFLYRGVAVFDPHYDIEKLVELRSQPDALKERA